MQRINITSGGKMTLDKVTELTYNTTHEEDKLY